MFPVFLLVVAEAAWAVFLIEGCVSCSHMPVVEACFGYVKLSVFGQSFECGTACAPIDCIESVLCPGFLFFDEGRYCFVVYLCFELFFVLDSELAAS
jgi:hypothetical protein